MKIRWKHPLLEQTADFGSKCCRTKTRVCILVAVIIVLVVLVFLRQFNVICSNYEIRRIVDRVCEQHSAGEAHGNMCTELCSSPVAIVADQCVSFHGGKEVVFSAIRDQEKVFIKGRVLSPDPPARLGRRFNGVDELHYPTLDEFELSVRRYLSDNYDIHLDADRDALDAVWPQGRRMIEEQTDGWRQQQVMENVWQHLVDTEFIFSRLYSQYDVFPDLIGVCGPLYVVEKVQPLDTPGLFDRPTFDSWSRRVSSAIGIMDLLEELDSIFHEPIHVCDMKSNHFGLSEHGRIKFLDVDSVFHKSVLDRNIGHNDECSTHSDCNFFDCQGECDLIEGVCRDNGVRNNNLQLACDKVFLGTGQPLYAGLLTSRHISKRLRKSLEACANPARSDDGSRIAANTAMKKELYSALQEIEDMSNKVKNEI